MSRTGSNVYEREGRWYYRFEIAGKDRRGVLAGAQTRDDAVALAKVIRQQLLAPAPQGVPTLAEAMDAWFRRHCDAQMKGTTKKRYEGAAKPLLAMLGHLRLTEIGRRELSSYTRSRMEGFTSPTTPPMRFGPVRPGSARSELTVLANVFRFAINEEMCTSNPAKDFDKRHLPMSNDRVRWLTEAQFSDLVSAAGRHSEMLGNAVRFSGHTGMRFTEQFSMLWEWVDLDAGLVRIPGSATKTSKPRSVPLDRAARSALDAMSAYRKLCRYVFPWRDRSGQYIRAVHSCVYPPYQTAVDAVGLQDFHWHDLRHHCASRWVRGGVDLYRVSKLLGHSSVTMTERYAHLAADDLVSVVSGLDRHDESSKIVSTLEIVST